MPKKAILTGVALFSMFLGGGNLIFPLLSGVHAARFIEYSFFGFALTGVLVPFFGLWTVLAHQGRVESIFAPLGSFFGRLFPLALLTFWIPLGSGPRCIVLAQTALELHSPGVPGVVFILLYSALSFVLTLKKSRVVDFLGYVMTPAILCSIGYIVVSSFLSEISYPIDGLIVSSESVFWHGFFAGLKTQDFIAAFFFSSFIYQLFPGENEVQERKQRRHFVMIASCTGLFLLSVVYFSMIYCGSVHAGLLNGLRGDQLLYALLTKAAPSSLMDWASWVMISMSCLSTSMALHAVFASYMEQQQFFALKYVHWVLISLVCCAGLAFYGFEMISGIIEPAMNFLYPSLGVLALGSFISRLRLSSS